MYRLCLLIGSLLTTVAAFAAFSGVATSSQAVSVSLCRSGQVSGGVNNGMTGGVYVAYIYVKNLLDPGQCDRSRGEIFDLSARAGWQDRSVPIRSNLMCKDGSAHIDVGRFRRA